MKKILNEQERQKLDRRIAETEKRTGAQVVLAVIERSDSYAELPWKAFALGASLSGLVIVIVDLLRPGWTSNSTVLLAVLLTLAIGAAAALLCVTIPVFARIFLDAHRAEVEVRQHAQSLFLSRELFGTCERTGILLLVSLFERQVMVLPDTKIGKRLGPEAIQKIIECMGKSLASGRIVAALVNGLSCLEENLSSSAPAQSGKNELSDEIIEEKES
jgi:putative membrane protein